MSIFSLLNKKCSWKRRRIVGINSYGESVYTEATIGSDIRCARQIGHNNNMRQLIDKKSAGDFSSMLVKYYLFPTDIQEDDIITFESETTEIVRNVRDAAGRGNHLEILAEDITPTGEEDHRVG